MKHYDGGAHCQELLYIEIKDYDFERVQVFPSDLPSPVIIKDMDSDEIRPRFHEIRPVTAH